MVRVISLGVEGEIAVTHISADWFQVARKPTRKALDKKPRNPRVKAYGDYLSTSVNYIVRFSVCVLFDQTKAVHSGATIPIKVKLCDSAGANQSSAAIALHAQAITQVTTAISGAVQDAGNANPDGDFRFEDTLAPGGGYIFNLKTTGMGTGTYRLTFTVGAESTNYEVFFQVK